MSGVGLSGVSPPEGGEAPVLGVVQGGREARVAGADGPALHLSGARHRARPGGGVVSAPIQGGGTSEGGRW